MSKTDALIILDGYGVSEDKRVSAIAAANTPIMDRLKASFPHTSINASGLFVGLPEGQMGNSEVGHLNMGAGRIVYQELTRITKSIKDKEFFNNEELIKAMDKCAKRGTLHLMGLLSDGGVHSHIEHVFALLEMAKERGVRDTAVHCFLDGRDVPPTSGSCYIGELEEYMRGLSYGRIATVMGRYYAMDRDNRWERVKIAYDAMINGEGRYTLDAAAMVERGYASGETDEFVKPVICGKKENPPPLVKEGDSIVFFNFRPDRARQITRALAADDFVEFPRVDGVDGKVNFVCMTQYDKTFEKYENISVAYKPQSLKNTFGEYVSSLGMTQLRIAETEKYAHVTFFFNGGVETPNENEDRALIPSPKVATYDFQPEMSAFEVADEAVKRVKSGKYDLMVLNFANADMVGHTGVFKAAIKAVEAVDKCLGKVLDAVMASGGRAIITADHGNADCMLTPDGAPVTAHSLNPVPFIICGEPAPSYKLREDGCLADVVPTFFDMLGIKKPEEMTGKSIIERT
ncbi:MAG: 2,3-bisphosphoglycerate-independent phosphoglycerate mutase [Christensenellales bacterium]|jgi:2,3-bisphosphoglycerate-independent phosphoglycerate mutase